ARDLAGRLGLDGRVRYLPADLLSDDFGASAYDAAMLGLITYILTPGQNRSVLRRAARALKPGGVLVIDAIMSTDRPREWASRATLLMRTWNGGAAHAFEQYRAWLLEAGFREVTRHNEQLLSAVR
ncbi:MAG: class I SAM-dependent methyltransferase, partial [Anaerolineae bacterium]